VIGPIRHDPQRLKDELLRTTSPVFVDTETTGVQRHDQLLSVGIRIDGTNHLLFSERCPHVSIVPFRIPLADVREALSPLASRAELVTVFHNLPFDLRMLDGVGVSVNCQTRDSLALVRLWDQERGDSSEEHEETATKSRTHARFDLSGPAGPQKLSYRLKDLGAHLCGIKPVYTPSRMMALVPYTTHARYLAHDLYATEGVYNYVWSRLTGAQQRYWVQMLAPLVGILLEMERLGVAVDSSYIGLEIERLKDLATRLSDAHHQHHGVKLAGLLDWPLRKLLYRDYKLPVIKGRKWKGALDDETIDRLIKFTSNAAIADSLRLIAGYRRTKSLAERLAAYLPHIDARSGRIHSQFSPRQATGRISSSRPNLQQIAKERKILAGTPFETTIRSRNLLVASSGYTLVRADLAQADVRMLGNAIATCTTDVQDLRTAALAEREQLIGNLIAPYRVQNQCKNPNFTGSSPLPPPAFEPQAYFQLVQDFFDDAGDFYSRFASQIAGIDIHSESPERGIYKTVALARINGMSIGGIKKTLGVSRQTATDYVRRFNAAYPEIEPFLALLKLQVALTGVTSTWTGRTRTMVGHRWMVTEPRIRVLLTYKDGAKFWFDAVPLVPALRYLTCYVKNVWSVADPANPVLVYNDQRGRIGTRWYPQLDGETFYKLPVRNLPWSNIRRVQRLDTAGRPAEQAKYEGLDATARSAINAVMQGGTADLAITLMLRSRDAAARFGARLVLQIHDELVWECPTPRVEEFSRTVKPLLEQPPVASFKVPIRVEMKVGQRFGEMEKIVETISEAPAAGWCQRLPRVVRRCCLCRKTLRDWVSCVHVRVRAFFK